MADKGAPTSCIAPPVASAPRSIATNPVLLINSITSRLASASSPDVKMTVRGLFGEKSCIQAIGMLLIDFTSRAPTAISATISLEVRPVNLKAARDLVTPARLISGLGPHVRSSHRSEFGHANRYLSALHAPSPNVQRESRRRTRPPPPCSRRWRLDRDRRQNQSVSPDPRKLDTTTV